MNLERDCGQERPREMHEVTVFWDQYPCRTVCRQRSLCLSLVFTLSFTVVKSSPACLWCEFFRYNIAHIGPIILFKIYRHSGCRRSGQLLRNYEGTPVRSPGHRECLCTGESLDTTWESSVLENTYAGYLQCNVLCKSVEEQRRARVLNSCC